MKNPAASMRAGALVRLRQARGVTLIEMMVAVLVLSVGLLGIAGLQAATSKYKINTWSRSQASVLLSDLAERVRVNPEAAGTSFASNGVTSTSLYLLDDDWASQQAEDFSTPPSTNCETAACTSAQRADFDLLTWRKRVRHAMPQGAALVSGDRAEGIHVTMMWFDKELDDRGASVQHGDTVALVKSRVCDGSEEGMAQQTCCPSEAAAPEGVRCARFTFVP